MPPWSGLPPMEPRRPENGRAPPSRSRVSAFHLPLTRQRQSAVGALVCDLQDDYQGVFRINDSTIRPRWLPPAPPLFGKTLAARVGPEWPMLDDPANWWRWALLAERAGARPPEVPGGADARMLAHNLAELWRAGLHRLAPVKVPEPPRSWSTSSSRAAGPPMVVRSQPGSPTPLNCVPC